MIRPGGKATNGTRKALQLRNLRVRNPQPCCLWGQAAHIGVRGPGTSWRTQVGMFRTSSSQAGWELSHRMKTIGASGQAVKKKGRANPSRTCAYFQADLPPQVFIPSFGTAGGHQKGTEQALGLLSHGWCTRNLDFQSGHSLQRPKTGSLRTAKRRQKTKRPASCRSWVDFD